MAKNTGQSAANPETDVPWVTEDGIAHQRHDDYGTRRPAGRSSAITFASAMLFIAALVGLLVYSARQPHETGTAARSTPAISTITSTEAPTAARAPSMAVVSPAARDIAPGRPAVARVADTGVPRTPRARKIVRPAPKPARSAHVTPLEIVLPALRSEPADLSAAFSPIAPQEQEIGGAPAEALAIVSTPAPQPAAPLVSVPAADPVVSIPLSPAPALPSLTIAPSVQSQDVVHVTDAQQPVVQPVQNEAVVGMTPLTDAELSNVRQPIALGIAAPGGGTSQPMANGP